MHACKHEKFKVKYLFGVYMEDTNFAFGYEISIVLMNKICALYSNGGSNILVPLFLLEYESISEQIYAFMEVLFNINLGV